MYLEISKRNCGKTERLINAALTDLLDIESGHTIHIVTRKEDRFMQSSFWQAFSERSGLIDLTGNDFECFRNRVYFETSYNLKDVADRINFSFRERAYFDEFEWFKINEQTEEIQDVLIKNGVYWCSTARKLYDSSDREPNVDRGDKKAFIFKLIDANGGVFSTAPVALGNALMHSGRCYSLEDGYAHYHNIFVRSEKFRAR
jgi:hypothetical protein